MRNLFVLHLIHAYILYYSKAFSIDSEDQVSSLNEIINEHDRQYERKIPWMEEVSSFDRNYEVMTGNRIQSSKSKLCS